MRIVSYTHINFSKTSFSNKILSSLNCPNSYIRKWITDFDTRLYPDDSPKINLIDLCWRWQPNIPLLTKVFFRVLHCNHTIVRVSLELASPIRFLLIFDVTLISATNIKISLHCMATDDKLDGFIFIFFELLNSYMFF